MGDVYKRQVISCFLQDTQGLIWIGSDKGLFSYDGYSTQPHFIFGERSNTRIYCGEMCIRDSCYPFVFARTTWWATPWPGRKETFFSLVNKYIVCLLYTSKITFELQPSLSAASIPRRSVQKSLRAVGAVYWALYAAVHWHIGILIFNSVPRSSVYGLSLIHILMWLITLAHYIPHLSKKYSLWI